MIVKTTKHSINNSNKITCLDDLFSLYKDNLVIYINYITNGNLPLKNNLSSKVLPTENIKHSRYRQLIYNQITN